MVLDISNQGLEISSNALNTKKKVIVKSVVMQ